MKREPKDSVKRALRKEVNYGCPVKGCGSPFLEWHHFDPRWSEKEHHNPSGMIALCTKCHPMADAGAFSNTQLRELKKNPNPLEFIKTKFPWMPENAIIRIGGCYAPGWCKVAIANEPIFEIMKNEDGLLELSLTLKNSRNNILAKIERNECLVYSKDVFDLSISASANRIKIWNKERQIGLEFRFSRYSIEELEEQLRKDNPNQTPKVIDNNQELYEKLKAYKEMSPELLEFAIRDPTGIMIRWHAMQYMGEEDKIPFMDLVNCRLYNNGELIEGREGRFYSERMKLTYCTGNTFSF